MKNIHWLALFLLFLFFLCQIDTAQTLPSRWVVAIGDLMAWYHGTETEFTYNKLVPTAGSIFAATVANYSDGFGRADVEQRTSTFIHLLCNHDLVYCNSALTDLQLQFMYPLPFGQAPQNQLLPSTPPVIPTTQPLPFGQTPQNPASSTGQLPF